MSEITQAYMSKPSGNCRATRFAPFCSMRHTVLWICRLPCQHQAGRLSLPAHEQNCHAERADA